MAIGDEVIPEGVAVEIGESSESFTRQHDPLHGTFVLVNDFHDVCHLGNVSVGMVENYNRLVVTRDSNGLRGAVGNQAKACRNVSSHRLPVEDCDVFRGPLVGFTDGSV